MFYIQGGWKVSRLKRTVIIPCLIKEDNGKKELNFHIDTGVAHQFIVPAKNTVTP